MSIAMSLVEVACEESVRLGDVRVLAVHLRLGPLSGVVADALRFSFDVASQGSAIEGARLEIEDMPVVVHCAACVCDRTVASVQHLRCPVCDAPTPDVVGGRELELFALEVDDHAAAHR